MENSRAHRGLVLPVVLLAALLAVGCKREGDAPSEGESVAKGVAIDYRGSWSGSASSCHRLAATCGPSGLDDCCKTLIVPGGTFGRSYDRVDYWDPNYPATVADFYLDKYEITVGRLRVFVNTGRGTQAGPPGDGAGAHPRIRGSGWDSTWNSYLAADTASLRVALSCQPAYQTWTDAPGSNESKPANCLDWYTAFAFCAWDGGRLATEAEWNYAASGGSEQRYYPWSSPATSTTIDDSYAVYCGGTCRLMNVGSKSPKGDGKWGHSDLGGNAWEWTLDWGGGAYTMPCHDCANVEKGSYRSFRSGSNDDIAGTLRASVRHVYYPEFRGNIGARCARDRL